MAQNVTMKNTIHHIINDIMRNLIATILFILPLVVFSQPKKYYFAANGDDSRTSVEAQNSATPWQTVSKLNSFWASLALADGDSVLFRRGDTFTGTITVNEGGSVSGNINVGAWLGSNGSARPIITGLTSISTWNSLGSNQWKSDASVTTLSSLNMVLINGVFAPIGRWGSVANSGYFNVTPNQNNVVNSTNGSTTLTSSFLTGTPNFAGGTVAIRKAHWVVDTGYISSQSTSTLTFTNPTGIAVQTQWGFFIQNHQSACDVNNEWWYDRANHAIGMYLSTGAPTGVQIATLDTLVNLKTFSFVSFNNLTFKGSNGNIAAMSSSSGGNHIIFQDCDFQYGGSDGINVTAAASFMTVNRCTFERMNNNGINGKTTANWTITNNDLHNCGAVSGMGSGGAASYEGIGIIGNNSTIQTNTVRVSGYNGIEFRGSNITVKNNYIDTFNIKKDDGGGIYTAADVPTVRTNQTVDGNIVVNGGGGFNSSNNAGAGTTTTNSDAFGIYFDGNSNGITLINNTMANCGSGGLFLNGDSGLIVRSNTIYNCNLTGTTNGAVTVVTPTAFPVTIPMRGVRFANNIIVQKAAPVGVTTTSYVANFQTTSESSMVNWVGVTNAFPGSLWDSNYYCRPISETAATMRRQTTAATATMNLLAWQQFTATSGKGFDVHSKSSPKTITDTTSNSIRFYENHTSGSVVYSFSGQTWVDMKNVAYSQSVTLLPYTSKVLLFSNNVSGTPLSVSLAAATNPVACNGGSTIVTATGVGGTTPYQFKVGTGSYQPASGNTFSFTATAGTYSVTIQDATLAVATASITITAPSAITITESHTAIAVNGNTSTSTIVASGGTGTLSYSINNGVTYQSSASFAGLLAGNYTVTVRDASLCTKTLSFTITQPSILALSLGSSTITCNGGTSTITATASGATPPYRYKLGTGAYQSATTFTGNRAGTYTVTCTDTAGAIVSTNITITEPAAIGISLSVGTAPATVAVTAANAVGTPNYSLDGGTFQTSNTFTGVAAGPHSITVRDANLCTNTKSFTVVVSPLRVTVAVGSITCNGGSATTSATPTGGTTPYTYLWSNGITTIGTTLPAGTGTLHVADAGSQVFDTSFAITQPAPIVVGVTFGTAPTTVTASCTSGCVGTPNYRLDGGSYQTSATFLNVAAGAHTVTIRDANLCVSSPKQFTVTTGSTPLAVGLSATTILCNGGKSTITATASGGTAPYRYKLSFWSSYLSSNQISNLAAGSYTVAVIDTLGATVSATISISQPSLISVNVAFGAAPTTVTVTATNTVNPPMYQLDPTGVYQLSNVFSAVAAGTHTVTVKDANNCTNSKSFTVLSSGLSVSLVVGTISCNGGTTTATATPSGGTSPYFYLWSNNQTTATATGLTAGTKTLHVTDNASHVFDTSFVITQPSAIVISSISFSAISSNGGSTTVTVTASGGVTSRTFSLDGGTYQSSNSFAGVLAGNHTMDVKDANGCIVRRLFSITQPGALIIHVEEITSIDCYGDSASIGVTATGGTPPYVGVDTFNVAAGTRTYTVTDAFGAIADSIVAVTQPTAIVATVRTGTITVRGGSTYVKILGTGGTGSYTFQLDGSGYSSTDSVLGVLAGNHVAYVKDANGCIDSYSFNIRQPRNKTHLFIPAANLYHMDWLVLERYYRRNEP